MFTIHSCLIWLSVSFGAPAFAARPTPGPATGIAAWRTVPLASIGLKPFVVKALAGTGVKTVGEALWATPDELLATPMMGHRMLEPLFTFLSKTCANVPKTPFPEADLGLRIKLLRLGILSVDDFLAQREELRQLIELSETDQHVEVWQTRRSVGVKSGDAADVGASAGPRWDQHLITQSDLSVRAINCLINDNINTVADLSTRSEASIQRLPNIGVRTLSEINLFLAARGLSLRDPIIPTPPGRRFQDIQSAKRRAALALKQQSVDAVADVRTLSVQDANFTVRLTNCLAHARLETIGDVITKSEYELWQIPHFGRRALEELNAFLNHRGLALRGSPVPSTETCSSVLEHGL